MALTKADIAEQLYEELGLNKREAKEFVEVFFSEISEILTEDDLDILFENQSNELDFFFAEISDEEIINYIDKENLDLYEFEDELLIF